MTLKGAGTHLTLSAAAGLAPPPGVSVRVTSGETSTPGVTDRVEIVLLGAGSVFWPYLFYWYISGPEWPGTNNFI